MNFKHHLHKMLKTLEDSVLRIEIPIFWPANSKYGDESKKFCLLLTVYPATFVPENSHIAGRLGKWTDENGIFVDIFYNNEIKQVLVFDHNWLTPIESTNVK